MTRRQFPVLEDELTGPDRAVATAERPAAPEAEAPDVPVRRALISVSDKRGVVEFARELAAQGIELISTDGTYEHLRGAGIPVTPIEQVTGAQEALDGRVKTLHPAVHIGILADRDQPDHMRQMDELGIRPIDLVCVNLKPFTAAAFDGDYRQAVEALDIGGPTLLCAAAKNNEYVVAVSDQGDYGLVLEELRRNRGVSLATSRRLAGKALDHASGYDGRAAAWMGHQAELLDGEPEGA